MRNPVDDALALAFDRAAGLESGSADAIPAALLAFARRVVSAGRRALETPACPVALLRRAVAIADAPPVPAGVREAVLALLFDSWAGAAPALRGAGRARFLRFGRDACRLDVELASDADGAMRLRGTVDGVSAPATLSVTGRGGKALRVPIHAGGSFALTVPAGSGPLTVAVRSGRRAVMKAGPIPPLSDAK